MLRKEEEEIMKNRRKEERNELKSQHTLQKQYEQREGKGVFLKDPKIDLFSIPSAVRSVIGIVGVIALLSMIPFDAYGEHGVACGVPVAWYISDQSTVA